MFEKFGERFLRQPFLFHFSTDPLVLVSVSNVTKCLESLKVKKIESNKC